MQNIWGRANNERLVSNVSSANFPSNMNSVIWDKEVQIQQRSSLLLAEMQY